MTFIIITLRRLFCWVSVYRMTLFIFNLQSATLLCHSADCHYADCHSDHFILSNVILMHSALLTLNPQIVTLLCHYADFQLWQMWCWWVSLWSPPFCWVLLCWLLICWFSILVNVILVSFFMLSFNSGKCDTGEFHSDHFHFGECCSADCY